MLANSMQRTTEPPVTMNEFSSQRGNWSFRAVRKPCSVGLVGKPSGWSITAAWVRNADEIITYTGRSALSVTIARIACRAPRPMRLHRHQAARQLMMRRVISTIAARIATLPSTTVAALAASQVSR